MQALLKDESWAVRGNYWLKRINPTPQYKARKRRVVHKPLVVSGHGIRLHVHCGTLVIQCGFTHHPQKIEKYRFFPQDRQLPSRLVIAGGNGNISLSALQWLSEQCVPLIQLNWRGKLSNVSNAAYAAHPDLVQKQWEIYSSPKRFEVAQHLISQKLYYSQEAIRAFPNPEAPQDVLKKISVQAKTIKTAKTKTTLDILNIEAIGAAAYFRYWYAFKLKWRGLKQKPVPPEWLTIGSRIGKNKSNQFAQHPVNAILNYAYAILESEVRSYILAAGADPSVGFIHSIKESNASLVFDLIEPVRPIMDKKVFDFIFNQSFHPDDFILGKDGLCRLHPQLARHIVKYVQDILDIRKVTELNLQKIFNTQKLKLG